MTVFELIQLRWGLSDLWWLVVKRNPDDLDSLAYLAAVIARLDLAVEQRRRQVQLLSL